MASYRAMSRATSPGCLLAAAVVAAAAGLAGPARADVVYEFTSGAVWGTRHGGGGPTPAPALDLKLVLADSVVGSGSLVFTIGVHSFCLPGEPCPISGDPSGLLALTYDTPGFVADPLFEDHLGHQEFNLSFNRRGKVSGSILIEGLTWTMALGGPGWGGTVASDNVPYYGACFGAPCTVDSGQWARIGEPGALVAFALGFAGLLGVRRMRRRATTG